jgi:hypothetical protein
LPKAEESSQSFTVTSADLSSRRSRTSHKRYNLYQYLKAEEPGASTLPFSKAMGKLRVLILRTLKQRAVTD